MKKLKGWPFEPIEENEIIPLGGGPGGGPGVPD